MVCAICGNTIGRLHSLVAWYIAWDAHSNKEDAGVQDLNASHRYLYGLST